MYLQMDLYCFAYCIAFEFIKKAIPISFGPKVNLDNDYIHNAVRQHHATPMPTMF